LPTGVTVLEASAGTGKTFTIAALAARYVAEGLPLERLLLVTFTRNATGELRERVRERLVSAERGLARALAGVPPPRGDDVLALLAGGPETEVKARRARLATALAQFDVATIETTHSFCNHVLRGLGVAGDVERDATFSEDAEDLLADAVDDLFVYRTLRAGTPPFGRGEAWKIAKAATENPFAPLEPAAAEPESVPGRRRRLAESVRAEFERRKRLARVITYDDMLSRLVDTLADPVRGPTARRRLRERYEVVLVDEFQDTDPIQWEIMRRAFAATGATLVLIGDPKQAIYAFRGADVYAYLDAAGSAAIKATLAVNWRSDQGLLDAYDALFAGAHLGHEGIVYRQVEAAPANQRPRLHGAPSPEPLRVRVVHRDDGLVRRTPKGYVSAKPGLAHVAADLAGDLAGLLTAGAEVETRAHDGTASWREAVSPRHVAVLVRKHRSASVVRDALEAVGIPAVINGAGSVFATPVAREWLALLEALERPTSTTRVHAATLSSFLGWTAERVATASEEHWDEVYTRLHQWAGVLRHRGVAAMLETISAGEALPARVLAHAGGERDLTDLRHVGQLLHAKAVSERLGVTALATWLRQRIAESYADTRNEERSRRLESDAEAIPVLTIHRSKGLEFPIVYYPDLWEPSWIPDDEPAVFHDAEGRRTIDVGIDDPSSRRRWRRFVDEQRGEDLRLAYVALTRARHQAVVWWASAVDTRHSSLSRLLFARDPSGAVASYGSGQPDDDEVVARFAELAAQAPGRIAVERTTAPAGVRWTGRPAPATDLEARSFGRGLDTRWRRTSYTGITAAVHGARVASEPEDEGVTDEGEPLGPAAAPAGEVTGGDGEGAALRAVPSLLDALPGGAAAGSLVHAVVERVDFAAADLEGDLREMLGQQLAWRHLAVADPDAVVAGLAAAIRTPLGPLLGDARLADFAASDRLSELDFELPLVGGDEPVAELRLDAVAAALRAHLPAGDALAGYADRLDDPALQRDLRGYLTGSIDTVLRVRSGGEPERFAVVDYKTNRLAAEGEALTAWHYRPGALAEAMQRAHYPLQALLYTVALHRYLRWRLPGYDPAAHLAGVAYLFVRGMTGPGTPGVGGRPCGVFAWQPPARLVEALSDLFDRGEAIS
jgi:exodeoxyribonuclease V beta subunit